MMFDFLNQYYKTKSIDQNQARLLNMYLEEDQYKGIYKVIALNTPGCESFTALAAGSVVRCIFNHREVLYAVAANKLYSISSAGTATERGTLNTSTGIVKWAAIEDEVLLVDGTNGYRYKVSTTTLAEITDSDFPDTAIDCFALGETFFVVNPASGQINYSEESDGTSWDALDFFTAETISDNLVGALMSKKELWLAGTESIEIWVPTSDQTFPFAPLTQVLIEVGLAAKNSFAKGAQTVFMLGRSYTGGFQVYQFDNSYNPVPISNRSITQQIENLDTVDDAIGFCYQQEGHEFYVLTFPTEGKTFVYDITTGTWHERTSYISAAYTRWRANCFAFCYGECFIGDYQSGKVLRLDTTLYQEDGQQIEREFVSSPLQAGRKMLTLTSLQIDFTSVNSSPTVDLQISIDGGHNFSTARSKIISSDGDRLLWTRNGSTRKAFVAKLRTTMNEKFHILGAVGEVLVGEN